MTNDKTYKLNKIFLTTSSRILKTNISRPPKGNRLFCENAVFIKNYSLEYQERELIINNTTNSQKRFSMEKNVQKLYL